MANIENLKLVRLSTGEELIGEVLSSEPSGFVIKNPVRVIMVPSKADPKNPSVAFAPYFEWSKDKEFTINPNHIIVMATPIEEFVNQYNGMYGGLVVPPTKLITP